VLLLLSIFILIAASVMEDGRYEVRQSDSVPAFEPPAPGEFDSITITTEDDYAFTARRSLDWQPESRPTIVFYHGFPDNDLSFISQMRFFRDQNYNVIAPPLRGYQSAFADCGIEISPRSMAGDVFALMQQTGLLREGARVHLVGHDWGSLVVQAAAMRWPSRFRSLTLVSVPPIGAFKSAVIRNPVQLLYSWYMLFFQLPWVPELWLNPSGSGEGVVYIWNSWSPFPYNPRRLKSVMETLAAPGVVKAAVGYYRQSAKTLGPGAAWGIFGEAAKESHELMNGRLEPPTLQIVGESDRCVHPASFDDALPLKRVPSAGHFVHHEQSDKFNQILKKWLKKNR